MSIVKINTYKQIPILFCLLCLSGCVTNIKQMDLNFTEKTKPPHQEISVEQLLTSAREQASVEKIKPNIYLTFTNDRRKLSATEKQVILKFAEQGRETLLLDCAPGSNKDKFSAAAIAIQRCRNIRVFLSQNHFSSEILLSPRLKPNQVRVYR